MHEDIAESVGPFSFRPCGSTGHEILDGNGTVIAWTVTEAWAVIVVGVLNQAEEDGLSGL